MGKCFTRVDWSSKCLLEDKEELSYNYMLTQKICLTHSFPMHPFSTPWKHQKTLRFSDVFREGRERVHWEQMG